MLLGRPAILLSRRLIAKRLQLLRLGSKPANLHRTGFWNKVIHARHLLTEP